MTGRGWRRASFQSVPALALRHKPQPVIIKCGSPDHAGAQRSGVRAKERLHL
jgi:hypothetical protein